MHNTNYNTFLLYLWCIMSLYEKSDKLLLQLLGQWISRQRLNLNLSQNDLAQRAGTSRNSVQSLEAGNGVKLLTFVQILRALGCLDELKHMLAADAEISPLQLAKLKGKRRQRASGERGKAGEK